MVEVGDASAFGVDLVELSGDSIDLGGEHLVVGNRVAAGERGFAREDHVGTQQYVAHLVEDEAVELVGADGPFGAALLGSSRLERVAVRADVVAVRGLAVAFLVGRETDCAAAAGHQASKQEGPGCGVAGREAGVVADDGLGCGEELGRDDGRHRHADPVLGGTFACEGMFVPGVGDVLVAVPGGGARVGGVAQQEAELGARPDLLLSGWRRNAVFVEVAGDLTDRGPGGVVVKDPSDDGRLGFVDLESGRAAFGARDSPIAVGDLPEDGLTGAHAIQLAAPRPLGQLGPFVLGEQALDLDEESGLGVVVDRRRVDERHADTEAGELVEDQDLVGEGAGQAVG
ncbi:MAG TPA: hypothetical protein VNF71_14720 [Acidimicrobiales bacterium]|nr:hypothetical protein [Acidimicrobiales bacterium]